MALQTGTEPANSKIVVLNPVEAALPADVKLSARPESLNGKVLGLLNNSKFNAEALLDQIADLMADRYEFATIIKRAKPTASRPCPQETEQELASLCDVIITSSGD